VWSFLPCMMINWFCLLFFFGMGKTNSSVSTYRSESLVILLLIFNWLQCNTSSIRNNLQNTKAKSGQHEHYINNVCRWGIIRNSWRLSPSLFFHLGKGAKSSGWMRYYIVINWISEVVLHDIHYWCSARVAHFLL
jgi:hypothetical protein